jgi:hypothetical protein
LYSEPFIDLNIDWLSSGCPLKRKLQMVISPCNLVGVIRQPTRVVTNSTGMKSSSCIDHIFTNTAEMSLKVAISRRTKVPKAGPNIVYKRSYNRFVVIPMLLM